ncbi:MAG: WXG100 family type VII secretion target [Actinomycetota bacterium]|nr:WXG100 family type VII secretion target [Actinomycetota bacterium]
MGGTKFSVANNAVNTHSTNLEKSEQDLNGHARGFIRAIEPLSGSWQGTSFGSWTQLTDAWNTAMAGLNKALADIKGRVHNAGALYDQYEQEQNAKLGTTFKAAKFDATVPTL